MFFSNSIFALWSGLFACVASPSSVNLLDQTLTLTLALDASHPATVLATGDLVPGDCVIEWGTVGGDIWTKLPERVDNSLSAILVGAPAGRDVAAQIVCSQVSGPVSTITTADFPADLPSLQVTTTLTEPIDEQFILTSGFNLLTGAASVTINNLEGDSVWWEASPGSLVNDAHFDQENNLVYWVSWVKTGEGGANLFLAKLAGETELWPLDNVHHDSLALGDGQYLVTQSITEETEEYGEVAGDTLSILDTQTGALSVVWNAFDQLAVVENDGWTLKPADWTHLNGLSLDPENGKIYASLYSDRSIVQIDATTWQTDWQIGGPSSDFTVDVEFGPQHSPLHSGNSLYMFNNGRDVAVGSELVGYTLVPPTAETAGTATQNWSWSPEAASYSLVMGSVALEADAILAAWGDTGEVRIISPVDDTVLSSYEQRLGGQAGQTSFIDLP